MFSVSPVIFLCSSDVDILILYSQPISRFIRFFKTLLDFLSLQKISKNYNAFFNDMEKIYKYITLQTVKSIFFMRFKI